MLSLPFKFILKEILIGICLIGAGITGLILTDLKLNKSQVIKVFIITSLLAQPFWFILIPFPYPPSPPSQHVPPKSYLWKLIARAYFVIFLAIVTGILAAKALTKYGSKILAIPRFLLGFLISTQIISLIMFIINRKMGYTIIIVSCIILGLLFTPINLLTPNFILAIMLLLGYSFILINGLFRLNHYTLDDSFYPCIIISTLVIVFSGIRLYYFYKDGSHLSSESLNAIGERRGYEPIRSGENQNYNGISNGDEEANIGNNP